MRSFLAAGAAKPVKPPVFPRPPVANRPPIRRKPKPVRGV